MAEVKVKFDTLVALKKSKGLRNKIFSILKKTVPDAIREYLNKGLSTIEGKGRLIAYKNPAKYPGKLKPSSPVNLKLSGKLHKAIKGRLVRGGAGGLEVGVFDSEQKQKALGLIKGDTRGAGGGARLAGPRPFMPTKNREKFNGKIQKMIVKTIVEEVTKFIKKTSK